VIDISNATLDVIQAIKTNKKIQFIHSGNVVCTVKPVAFHGDFDGIITDKEQIDFSYIDKWVGIVEER
tara:strand:- start:89 stop:292 length:204 start_codon:yes stop_codon:yes gene_type:complete